MGERRETPRRTNYTTHRSCCYVNLKNKSSKKKSQTWRHLRTKGPDWQSNYACSVMMMECYDVEEGYKIHLSVSRLHFPRYYWYKTHPRSLLSWGSMHLNFTEESTAPSRTYSKRFGYLEFDNAWREYCANVSAVSKLSEIPILHRIHRLYQRINFARNHRLLWLG